MNPDTNIKKKLTVCGACLCLAYFALLSLLGISRLLVLFDGLLGSSKCILGLLGRG